MGLPAPAFEKHKTEMREDIQCMLDLRGIHDGIQEANWIDFESHNTVHIVRCRYKGQRENTYVLFTPMETRDSILLRIHRLTNDVYSVGTNYFLTNPTKSQILRQRENILVLSLTSREPLLEL